MLFIDQLKKNDPHLRWMAMIVLGGLGVLLTGLWWVQIVSAREYQEHLETQSFRTVRIPAVRGAIQDRNGIALAENRPSYNLSLYLEELRKPIDVIYNRRIAEARAVLKQRVEQERARLKRNLTKEESRQFALTSKARSAIRQQARNEVASNVVSQASGWLQQPITLNLTNIERHYQARLALPYPILFGLDPGQVARFEENAGGQVGVDIEIQSTRVYPFQATAFHLLGSLRRDDASREGEEAFFSYRLPDFCGVSGIEFAFDKQLRGSAGAKSVLVNNLGYRQTENIWSPASPGHNVVLTIDFHIQRAAEAALKGVFGPETRGAAVVMHVESGDILAMVSSPSIDPNRFVQGFTRPEWAHISALKAEKNRATQENYAPGSIFKIVVGLAALEAGLDPLQVIYNPGYINIPGRRPLDDLARPGNYDFRRALKLSSNYYFVTNGWLTGAEKIVALGKRLHLGERTGLLPRQETPGIFPESSRGRWSLGETALLSIGQGPISVTPLQMTVMTAAVANGGKVLWPRLVQRVEAADPTLGEPPVVFPPRQFRDELGVSARNLKLVQDAMLADVEDADGTGRGAAVAGFRVCGKTGTAQIQNSQGDLIDHTTWFASFAPYERPQYAVVVMVESGASGGTTCAPVAARIYRAILERERMNNPRNHLARAD
jgi:penicillin-binding protein 2